MKVLITGGCGYIGSHTAVRLLESGEEVVIIDNLINSKIDVLDKIKEITGKNITFYQEDLCNLEELRKIFKKEKFDAVIHFAGLKAVGESVEIPLKYYQNNLVSTMNILSCMQEFNVLKLVFSSSATVYGSPKSLPILEDFPLSTTNPYGTTKLMIEQILTDVYKANNKLDITILRYFNPIGAHKSGLLGEDPNGIPNNLMPYIVKVATKQLPVLNIFGSDYDTIDGTGVRDYIHVMDLAEGHILALKNKKKGLKIYNLGTGKGTSVLELVNMFSKINNVKVNYKIVDRRPGDIASCYASSLKANKELGFTCKYTLEDMCKDSYNFVKKNSNL
ncbi:MAG: UDP-glucose 4-epimerase GalE [Erysipelotrichaceae bacterium]|nr:UDP-glucose 4-epimerase GalE [Erysipelotrichaceae bacterium]